MNDWRPLHKDNYPPFTNGRYIEEYFYDFWNKQAFKEKDQFEYIDIFWNSMFHQHGVNATISLVKDYVVEKCKNTNKIVFTVCQWDDNICFGPDKPHNLIVFSSCHYEDVCLPLNTEDVEQKLQGIPRKKFKNKSILCSFIGSITHEVRRRMCDALRGEDFYISSKPWSGSVDGESSKKFIEISQDSKFGLAPRGYGVSSFRFFELMQLGVVPIYIHDGIIGLPYMDIIDYDNFSIVIHINEIDRLKGILESIDEEKYNTMLHEMEKVRLWFTMEGTCEYILQNLRKRVLQNQDPV